MIRCFGRGIYFEGRVKGLKIMQENMRLGEQRSLGVKEDCCAVVDVVGAA